MDQHEDQFGRELRSIPVPLPPAIEATGTIQGYDESIALPGLSTILEQAGLQETPAQEQIVNGMIEEEAHGILNRIRSAARRNMGKIALGATVASVSVTLLADPFESTKEKLIEAAPWVLSGVGVSETLFVGGAAMMLAGVGDRLGNPFTIKSRLPEISDKAAQSRLFKAGFWTNTVGAVGDFVAIASGVMLKLPVHSWGIMSLAFLDLGVTVSVRRSMSNGIKRNSRSPARTDGEIQA